MTRVRLAFEAQGYSLSEKGIRCRVSVDCTATSDYNRVEITVMNLVSRPPPTLRLSDRSVRTGCRYTTGVHDTHACRTDCICIGGWASCSHMGQGDLRSKYILNVQNPWLIQIAAFRRKYPLKLYQQSISRPTWPMTCAVIY